VSSQPRHPLPLQLYSSGLHFESKVNIGIITVTEIKFMTSEVFASDGIFVLTLYLRGTKYSHLQFNLWKNLNKFLLILSCSDSMVCRFVTTFVSLTLRFYRNEGLCTKRRRGLTQECSVGTRVENEEKKSDCEKKYVIGIKHASFFHKLQILASCFNIKK